MSAPGIRVRGISGLVVNFHALNAAVQREVREAMEKEGRAQQQATRAAAPKRTGFMAAHTRLEFSPQGLAFSVGYHEEDWEAAGLYPYFYPVILGSSTQSANNFLFNVHEAHRAAVTKAVGDAVRRGAESIRV